MLFKGQLYYVAVAVFNQWRQNIDNYLRTFNSPIGKVKVSVRRIINRFNFPLGKKMAPLIIQLILLNVLISLHCLISWYRFVFLAY